MVHSVYMYYHAKCRLANSFQVTGDFLVKNTKIVFKVKGQGEGHQTLITSVVHHIRNKSHQCLFSSLSVSARRDTYIDITD